VSKKARKEVSEIIQQNLKDKVPKVEVEVPKTDSFAKYISPRKGEPTRYSQGWKRIPSRDGGIGWVRASKDCPYEVEYFSVPFVPDTLAEHAGFILAHDTNNNRSLAVEISQSYGSWGAGIYMRGFDSFSKVKRERPIPDEEI
jgi:hypothetical protein